MQVAPDGVTFAGSSNESIHTLVRQCAKATSDRVSPQSPVTLTARGDAIGASIERLDANDGLPGTRKRSLVIDREKRKRTIRIRNKIHVYELTGGR